MKTNSFKRDLEGRISSLPTHGRSYTREYDSWKHAKQRCFNPNDHAYHWYGARGITMCDEWKNSFEAFFRDMGPCPEGRSLDRRDNNLGYFAGNCRWATRTEQTNNRRRQRDITYQGETLNIMQWAKRLGINGRTLHNRIYRSHWPIEKAMTKHIY